MQQRAPRFKRDPDRFESYKLTERSIAIVYLIALYRFIGTSYIMELVGGDRRTTAHHLQLLYHRNVINRIQLSKNSEFTYFLDRRESLQMLVEEAGINPDALDFEAVRNNREKAYAKSDDPGRRLFLRHELAISRFHFMVEQACRNSGGNVVLSSWQQGARLRQSIDLPELAHDARKKQWYETDKSERVSVWPDALFTLSFPSEPEREPASFVYEQDRRTITKIERMRARFRAHFEFIARAKKHRDAYGIRKIRAVLVETLDGVWGERLRAEARHETVTGRNPSPLFWFTTAEVLTRNVSFERDGNVVSGPRFMLQPEFVFQPIWATPVDDTLHSLLEL